MPLLSVSGLSKRFGALRAVHEVSFAVDEGEVVGLIGRNGSGKSTTFNCIAGLYRPSAGSIVFEGAEIGCLTADRVCHKGIGRTFQIPRPFRNLTLLENVALSAFFGRDKGVTRQKSWTRASSSFFSAAAPSPSMPTRASVRRPTTVNASSARGQLFCRRTALSRPTNARIA